MTLTASHGIFPGTPIDLVGTIGHAALSDLLPAHRRQRVKARTRKNPTSKYGPNAGQHPQKAQNYTVHTTVAFFEGCNLLRVGHKLVTSRFVVGG
ncbi:hypothetical protein ACWD3J_46945 [Streptomyces sp. NPDC002755]|uniref:hypothetical protein n=1 Tax=Streptomyces sp. NPDC002884 TaxID=3154544 RepID=UPI00332179E3